MRSGGECERHHQKLGFVCVKSDCLDKGLICNLCAREQHSSHGIMTVSTFVDAYLESSQLANSVGELIKQYRGMKNNGIEIAQQFDNLSKNLSAQIASAQAAILANLECDMAWIENIVSREQSDFEQLEMELQLKGQYNQSQHSGISQEAVLKLLKRVKDVNIQTNSLQVSTLSQIYSKTVNLLVKKNARIKTNILSETPKFASDFKSYFSQVNSALQAYDVKSNLQQVNLQSLLFPGQQGYKQTTQQPQQQQFQPVQQQYSSVQLVRGQEDRLQSFGVQPYFLNEQNSQGNSKSSTARNASPLPVFASTTDKLPPELSPSQSFTDLRRNPSRNQNQNSSLNKSQRQIKEEQEVTANPQYQQQFQQDTSFFIPNERGQPFSRSKSPVQLQSEQKQQEQLHLQRYQSVQTSTASTAIATAAALTTQSTRGRGINTTPNKKIFGSTTTIIPPLRISTSQPKDTSNGIQQPEYYSSLQLQPITSQIMTESAIKKQNELIINTSSPLQSNFSNTSDRKMLGDSKSSQGQNSNALNGQSSSYKPMFGNDSKVFSNKKSPQQVSDFNQEVQYFKFNNNGDKDDAAFTNPQYNSVGNRWNTNEQTAASQNSIPSLGSPNPKSSVTAVNQPRSNNKKESFVGGLNQKKNSSLSQQSSLSVSFQENEKISLIGHQNGVKCLETLGTDRILSGGGDSLVKLWDRDELKFISQLEGHRKGVYTIKAEQTHRIIASGDGEGTILIWRYAPTIKKTQILKGHSNQVTGIVFENERRIISCSTDGYVIIWDLEKGSCVLKLEQQKSILTSLEIHGNMLLGACDKFVLFYELAGYKLLKKVEAHDGQINQISLIVRGKGNQPYIMTCSVDGCLFVWDGADTYEELDMIQEEGNKWNIACFEYCRVVDLLIYASNSKFDQISKIHSYNLNSKTSVLIADINCRINALKVIGNELYVAMENNMIQMVLIHKQAG